MSVSAKVLFDYEAEQDDELTLAVGDIITNVVQEDGGWWRGDLKGRTGVFPENFVTINGEVPAPVASAIGGSFKALVKYDYEQEQPDELTLKEGDIINDIEIVDDGWWKGTCKGKNGLFPSNFVEKIDDDANTKPAVAPEPELRHDAASGDAPASVMKSLFSGMKPSDARNRLKKVAKPGHDEPPPPPSQDLKPTQMVPPMVPPASTDQVDARKKVPVIPPPATDAHPTNQPPKPVQKAKVLFDYEPEQSDELKLEVGTIITVIDSELTFDGWMKGEVDGVVGVFPDNFVELLPPEPSSIAPTTGPPGVVLPNGMPPAGLRPPAGLPGQDEMAVKEEPISSPRPHHGPPTAGGPLGAGNPLQSELAKKLSARTATINNQMSQSGTTNNPPPPMPNQPTKAASKAPPPPLPGNKPSLPGTKPKPGSAGKPMKPPFMKPQETTPKPEPSAINEVGKRQPQVNESTDPSVVVGTLLTTPEATGELSNTSNLSTPGMAPSSAPPVPVMNGEVKVEVDDGSHMSLNNGPAKLPLTASPSLSDTVKPTEPLKHLERAKPPGKSPPSKFKDKSAASSPPRSPPTSSVSTKEVEDLKQQVHQLQSKMAEMEGKFNRLLTQVTDDLGEERKLRLSQQVEIDSLKKKLHVMNG